MIKTKKRGMLVVISGPSGCGKGTVIQAFLKENKASSWLSISATSRPKRKGDIENVSYYFLTAAEFEKKIEEGAFLEYATYAGNYYGTPKEPIEEKLRQGIDVFLEIEIQGALKVKEVLPEAIFIFILPPSMKELKKRLVGRNTEDKEKQEKRFQRAYQEINEVSKYNYVLVNDKVEDAVKKITAILMAERLRVDRIEEVLLDSVEEEIHEELLPKKPLPNVDISKKINEIKD